jgi:hypothetical protein
VCGGEKRSSGPCRAPHGRVDDAASHRCATSQQILKPTERRTASQRQLRGCARRLALGNAEDCLGLHCSNETRRSRLFRVEKGRLAPMSNSEPQNSIDKARQRPENFWTVSTTPMTQQEAEEAAELIAERFEQVHRSLSILEVR